MNAINLHYNNLEYGLSHNLKRDIIRSGLHFQPFPISKAVYVEN